jgi:tetratricopeptide (TPR) repeat protein
MAFVLLLFIGQLYGSSGLINVPSADMYEMPGMWGIGFDYSQPLYRNETDPNAPLQPEPSDVNAVLRYGFGGRGEISLYMYTPSTYALSIEYLIKKAGKGPAFFCGIDNITYSTHVSLLGRGDTVGFLEEKGYFTRGGGRPPELLSAYVGMQQTFGNIFNVVVGLGRGRFVGYGERSHVFNTDFFVLGDNYTTEEHSSWAFGLFFGTSLEFPFGLELMADMDGRDISTGIRYNNKYLTPTFAITKVEQFGDRRPFSPRITLGIEATNRFMLEKPKLGTVEVVIQDVSSQQPLANAVVEVAEINKRYFANAGSFSVSLQAGNYTMKVTKPDYVDYVAKVNIKPDVRSKLVFNMLKTEQALRLEAATRERENSIRNHLEQGGIYLSENNLIQAKAAYEMVLTLDAENEEAQAGLKAVDVRRTQLIDYYITEARKQGQAKAYSKAIELWQQVLVLDPENVTAETAIANLQKQQTTPSKPPAKSQKPAEPAKRQVSQAEIEALYKKGVSLFANDRYDEALNVFKQVLALDPNHVGAKDYLKRTQARIAILKGG